MPSAILAFRSAPVQVNYLSYPGIVGTGHIDYILADRFVIPEDHRALFREPVVYLPDTYLGYDAEQRMSERIPTRAELGLPETGFVFCAYNNNFKILPQAFDVWMRLLGSVPGSVLWLSGANATAVNNLRREATARGVDPARLCFAPFVKEISDHLVRYRLVDLFLDTLPFNAHTTACDALWAGVPVLDLPGPTFVGRVAASLLSAVGLPELITNSMAEYEALALQLATDAALLAGIKAKLERHRGSHPLFDSRRFTAPCRDGLHADVATVATRRAARKLRRRALLIKPSLCGNISPFVPAEAGAQFLQQSLGPRVRGDERFDEPISISIRSRSDIARAGSGRRVAASDTDDFVAAADFAR